MLDKDYELFVQQAIATKIADRKKPDEGRVDKFTIND
jgi:hypothetical protein